MNKATFAATIRARRVELGIRQLALSAKLGYAKSSTLARLIHEGNFASAIGRA